MFDPRDWYWSIGGGATRAAPRIYGSRRNIYVEETDPEYQIWAHQWAPPNKSDDEAGIWHLLQDVIPAWLYDGETFSQPAAGQYTKPQLQRYSAMIRWQTETTPITGPAPKKIPLKMDDRSKQMIGNAAATARASSTFTTKWVGADGQIYPVTASDIIGMSDAVSARVDACFETYAATDAQILAGAVTTLEAIEAAYASMVVGAVDADLSDRRR